MAIILAKLKFSHLTGVWELNVAYLQTAGAVNEKTTQAAGTAIGNAWFGALEQFLSNQVTFESVHTRMVDDGPFPTRVQNRIDDTGSNVTAAIPSILCAIVNFRNSGGLLKRPGRVFVSGLGGDTIDDGVLNSGARDLIQTNLNNDCLEVTDASVQLFTGELVIARRAIGPGPPIPYTSVPITDIEIPLELGSQLKRKGRKTGLKV